MATRTIAEVTIGAAGATLEGDLAPPEGTAGVIAFAHGSGSSRRSPRNRAVAERFQQAGFGTLLFDLLTPEEAEIDAQNASLRFDIELLTGRLLAAVDWLAMDSRTAQSAIGLFGASTGAAAALRVAAARPDEVGTVVSRGGRADLAGEDALRGVAVPALLIVGERDPQVLELNHQALQSLTPTARLETVENATHLFEEPGALDRVAELALDWFRMQLPPVKQTERLLEEHQAEHERVRDAHREQRAEPWR